MSDDGACGEESVKFFSESDEPIFSNAFVESWGVFPIDVDAVEEVVDGELGEVGSALDGINTS